MFYQKGRILKVFILGLKEFKNRNNEEESRIKYIFSKFYLFFDELEN